MILGTKIKIPKKAMILNIAEGSKIEYCCEHIEVLIGIGNDHTASLIMSVEDWQALNKGNKIHITKCK